VAKGRIKKGKKRKKVEEVKRIKRRDIYSIDVGLVYFSHMVFAE